MKLNKEQQEIEGYEKRGKTLVNGDSKETSRQKIDMGREKGRFLYSPEPLNRREDISEFRLSPGILYDAGIMFTS